MKRTPKTSRSIVVAIDGPSGTGKSTIARLLAGKLKARHIDTGAMYRAVALLAVRNKVDVDSPGEIVDLLKDFRIDYKEEDGNLKVFLSGEDVTEALRKPGIGEEASRISRFPEIREILVEKQRELAGKGSAVMEGRDIGTVVLPDADLKVFLDADEQERARRRYLEWKEKGIEISEEKLEEEIRVRDQRDSTRETAPLTIAQDAVRVDTTHKTIEEVLDEILALVESKSD